jgi:hypothetical protein
MDKLPKEALIPDAPTLADLKPGDIVWVTLVNVDAEGTVWLHKAKEFTKQPDPDRSGNPSDIEVSCLVGGGWSVKLPKNRLPIETCTFSFIEEISFKVTEIDHVGR